MNEGRHRLDEALADWVRCRRDRVFWFSASLNRWGNNNKNTKSEVVGGL